MSFEAKRSVPGFPEQSSADTTRQLQARAELARTVRGQLQSLIADEPVDTSRLAQSLRELTAQMRPGEDLLSALRMPDFSGTGEDEERWHALLDYAAHPGDYAAAPEMDDDEKNSLAVFNETLSQRESWLAVSQEIGRQGWRLVLSRNVWRIADEHLRIIRDVSDTLCGMVIADKWVLLQALTPIVSHMSGAPRRACAMGRSVGDGQLEIEVEVMPRVVSTEVGERWAISVRLAKSSVIKAAMAAIGTEKEIVAGPLTIIGEPPAEFLVAPPETHSWWLYMKWKDESQEWVSEKLDLQMRKLPDETNT
jgi:hypothetical protein